MKKHFELSIVSLFTIIVCLFASSCSSDDNEELEPKNNAPAELFGKWLYQSKTDTDYRAEYMSFHENGQFYINTQMNATKNAKGGLYSYKDNVISFTPTVGSSIPFSYRIKSLSSSSITVESNGETLTYSRTQDDNLPIYTSHKGQLYVGKWLCKHDNGSWDEYTFNIHGEFVWRFTVTELGNVYESEGTYNFYKDKNDRLVGLIGGSRVEIASLNAKQMTIVFADGESKTFDRQ